MKITVLIIGLVMAAVVGGQSFLILANPFTPSDLRGPASLGIMVALVLAIGAAFALSVLRVSMGCFAVAGVAAFIAGRTTGFHDLAVWGSVTLGLVVLSFVAQRNDTSQGNRLPTFHLGSYQQPPADYEPAAEMPIHSRASEATARDTAVRAVAAPLSAETNVVDQLERLAALKASGGLTDEEFSALKADLVAKASR